MPYRRLPNTDVARIKALEIASNKINSDDDSVLSDKFQSQIFDLLPKYKATNLNSKDAKTRQNKNSVILSEHTKKARLYISHFIQVLNFCILRSEMKPEVRKYYGLDESNAKVPSLLREKDILFWGEKIINGEHERLMHRQGNPIYSPSIALVRVHYDNFKEKYSFQKGLQNNSARFSKEITKYRNEADKIILKLWNAIEEKYLYIEDEEDRRCICEQYGITYVYRKGERERIRQKKEAERITLSLNFDEF